MVQRGMGFQRTQTPKDLFTGRDSWWEHVGSMLHVKGSVVLPGSVDGQQVAGAH